ncbi:MAG: hypothetical protein R3Y12_02030 [Clostridia bacterium]
MIKLKTTLVPVIIATYMFSRFSPQANVEPDYNYDINTQTINYNTEEVLDRIITENFRLVLSNLNLYTSIYDVLDDLGVEYDEDIIEMHLFGVERSLLETLKYIGIDVFSLTDYLIPVENDKGAVSRISANFERDTIMYLPLVSDNVQEHTLQFNAQILLDVDDEYSKVVSYVSSRGIMIGVSSHRFSGNEILTREMLAKALHNIFMQGQEIEYEDALSWAYLEDIMTMSTNYITNGELRSILSTTYKKYLGIDIETPVIQTSSYVTRYNLAEIIYEIHNDILTA